MMSLTEQAERTAFYDVSLERCLLEGDSLLLDFPNITVAIGTEEYYRATVILSGVREIRRFGEPVTQLTMEGEVLQFRKGEGKALLLVEWHSHQPNTSVLPDMKLSMPPPPSP